MFAAQMVGFATAMFGLVAADSFLLMYVFWEITSVLSYLLVSYYAGVPHPAEPHSKRSWSPR